MSSILPSYSEYKIATELVRDLVRQKEDIILDQLGDLLTRGLLMWEETRPVITKEFDSNVLTVRSAGRLVLRDREYIEKLEAENAALKEQLFAIKDGIKLGREEG